VARFRIGFTLLRLSIALFHELLDAASSSTPIYDHVLSDARIRAHFEAGTAP
jgi:hypothetical protein